MKRLLAPSLFKSILHITIDLSGLLIHLFLLYFLINYRLGEGFLYLLPLAVFIIMAAFFSFMLTYHIRHFPGFRQRNAR